MNRQGLVRMINDSFPTQWHNAWKFGIDQVLMSIAQASLSRGRPYQKIVNLSGDGLVKTLLKLD